MQRATSTVLARVARTVAAHRMIAPAMRVLVAVSGGPDSIGLLCILAALRRKLRIEIVAANVNHHLRGRESDADEDLVAHTAQRLDVPFVRADLPTTLRFGGNLESRARDLRYQALHRLAEPEGCARIATGHTRDDQAETVVLRLIRGSGIGGLAGIEPVRSDGVIRPLFDCTRDEVEMFVRSRDQEYRLDASNSDERFLRARVRRTVMPVLQQLNPAIVENLVRVAALSAAEQRIVAAWTADQLSHVQPESGLEVNRLQSFPRELRSHLVRAWLLALGVDAVGLTARHIDAVVRLASGSRASGETRLRGTVIVRRYGHLQRDCSVATVATSPCVLAPGGVAEIDGWRIEADAIAPRSTPSTSADLWSAVFDATALSEALVVRTARIGERVRPLGLHGRHRKLSDVFIDKKIPASERRAYPLVSYGDEILWVPGVIRSELLPVRVRTETVLRLRAKRCASPGS